MKAREASNESSVSVSPRKISPKGLLVSKEIEKKETTLG